MRAGSLDRTVEIVERIETPRRSGGIDEQWRHVASIRAQRIDASTEVAQAAFGADTTAMVAFRTRWRDGVFANQRVVDEGLSFDVIEIKPIGRRRGLELRCRAAKS